MAEQLCPVCGCEIVNGGHEQEGATYCCQPCGNGGSCECGCCAIAEEPESD